jgi:DNA-binding transcriptional MerR regulator
MSKNQIPRGERQHTNGDAAANTNAATMTIGELSAVTGLSASAIRFYQRRGLLPARDADSGWQRYGRDALDRLAVIELAKSAGFNLDEVIRILDAVDTDPDSVPAAAPVWQGLAEAKIADIDAHIERLQQMRELLQDAMDYSYLSPDRVRRVPATLGWTAEQADGTTLPHAVQIPTSTRDLDTATTTDLPVDARHDRLTTQG